MRSLCLGLAALVGIWGLVGPATAGEQEESAWQARIEQIVDRVEDQVRALDGKAAEEEASLGERLKALHERLTKIEKSLDLSTKRFHLYEGSDSVRRLSSLSQMATSLEARASRAAQASKTKMLAESAERARRARIEREREAARLRQAEDALRAAQDQVRKGSGRTTARTRKQAPASMAKKDNEPRLVAGRINNRNTISLVNVPLAKDLRAEFTVFFDPPETKSKEEMAKAAASGETILSGNGGKGRVESAAGTPDPVLRLRIVARPEGMPYPRCGPVEFKTGTDGKTPEEQNERKVETQYIESAALTSILGGTRRVQMLNAVLCGPELRGVVDRDDICVTQVDGKVSTTATTLSGKSLDLLRQLLSVYEEAGKERPDECPAGPPGTYPERGGERNTGGSGD